jgi:hypothetical protein
MIEQGPASDDDVALAFLQAEIESPKWGPHYRDAMQARGLDRASLIDAVDLSDARANRNRRNLLGDVRGFGRGCGLFQRFPLDTKWRHVLVEAPDFYRLKYISGDADWLNLSGGTRLVQDGARNLDAISYIAEKVRATQRGIEQGRSMAGLILASARDPRLCRGGSRGLTFKGVHRRGFQS